MNLTYRTKWESIPTKQKVAIIEHRREQREQYPDSEYERFRALEIAQRKRIQKHVKKILELRAS